MQTAAGASPQVSPTHAPYACPVHRGRTRAEQDAIVGVDCGCRYPVIDGVPVLIADPAERERVIRAARAQTTRQPDAGAGGEADAAGGEADAAGGEADAADFYNCGEVIDQYLATYEPVVDINAIEEWLRHIDITGPVLEIGSGRGGLQGRGGDYVAVDYSLIALLKFVRPEHQRVCASAERLPFPAETFRMLFTVACFEHVPAADRAFEEVHRVLKPGGIAYLAPAWHCVQYICDGVPVRPYSELSPHNKFVKATLPIRRSKLTKALATLPKRTLRRLAWRVRAGGGITFRFSRLRPSYDTFWMSDSDACSRIDSHEACLFFKSCGYGILRPGDSALRQLMAGHGAVVVRRPS